MKKVARANTYFLIIILLQLFLPVSKIFSLFNITDVRLMLFISHTITFIVPAIIYLIVTKQSPKDVLKLNKLYFKDALLIILLAFVCQPIMTFFSLISQFNTKRHINNTCLYSLSPLKNLYFLRDSFLLPQIQFPVFHLNISSIIHLSDL